MNTRPVDEQFAFNQSRSSERPHVLPAPPYRSSTAFAALREAYRLDPTRAQRQANAARRAARRVHAAKRWAVKAT